MQAVSMRVSDVELASIIVVRTKCALVTLTLYIKCQRACISFQFHCISAISLRFRFSAFGTVLVVFAYSNFSTLSSPFFYNTVCYATSWLGFWFGAHSLYFVSARLSELPCFVETNHHSFKFTSWPVQYLSQGLGWGHRHLDLLAHSIIASLAHQVQFFP